ncbi:MAG: condensation domain-containing protein [Planctomycetaceae bacterium]
MTAQRTTNPTSHSAPAPSGQRSRELSASLPATVFERFVLNSEDHAHRMIIRVVLRLTGETDSKALTAAWNEAVIRHPLLMSRISVRDGVPCWVATDPPTLTVEYAERSISDIDHGAVGRMPLSEQPGFAGRAIIGDDGLLITLDVHHACSDGTGMRQLIAEWMHLYDCRVRGLESQLPPADPALLQARDEIVQTSGDSKNSVGGWEGIRNFLLTVRGRTVRPGSRLRAASGESAQLAAATCFVEAAVESAQLLPGVEQACLRRTLKQFDVTLNDLLLACCMLTVSELWPNARRSDRITILNPVDLRRPSDRFLSACNRFGVVFLRRKFSHCGDPVGLLRGLHDEMTYIKNKQVAVEFLKGMQQLEKVPGGPGLFRRLGWFVPTLQFTCLGDITRVPSRMFRTDDRWVYTGHLRFESATGIPPLPPGSPLSVAACLTGPRLTLGVRTSSDVISEAETQRILATLIGQLQHICGCLTRDRNSQPAEK